MYGYEEYFDLTPEHILQKISQEDIFKIVFGEDLDIDLKYINPIREGWDNSPGCWFEYYEETLLFMDFGDKVRHRSCFKMIMDYYEVTLKGALKLICKHYSLSTVRLDYSPVIYHSNSPKSIYQKTATIITYEKREVQRRDIIYWSQYIIRPEHLIEDKVYPINRCTIYKGDSSSSFNPYHIAYAYDFGDRVKIYQPLNTSGYKWITNCNNNDIGNIQNLPDTANQLIITKSYKDHRTLRNLNLGFNVIWLQNEGQVPNKEILTSLIKRFKDIVIFFDNDNPGIQAAQKLSGILNEYKFGCARMVFLPKRKYKWKDPSDFVKKEGRQDLIKELIKLKITNGRIT